MEANNLAYIRHNQSQLFAEVYRGLIDHVNVIELLSEQDHNVGRRVILPSTFDGGPRIMKQCNLDAMEIVRKYRRPDLFITFTCNPRWPEIIDNLGRGVVAADRLYLVSRVFHLKLKALFLTLCKTGCSVMSKRQFTLLSFINVVCLTRTYCSLYWKRTN